MIEKLTPEQEARFPEFVKKWTAYGLCTEPANRPDAERAIALMYKRANLKPPTIVWCGSPMSNAITRALVVNKKGKKSVGDSVGDSVRVSVGDSVGASVRDSVWASVGASVWASVGASVYGQHDANWLSFYDFFQEVCGLESETSPLDGLWLLARSAGWALPHKNICWVSERHNVLNRDDRGRLHCENGMALVYPDGWGIYSWHGTRVSKEIIEHPERITIKSIESEKNTEVRCVMMERFGWEKFLLDSGAKEINRDEFGILYRKDIPGDEPLVMVRVVNGTPEKDGHRKEYFLKVPQHGGKNFSFDRSQPEIVHARQAVAWTYGLLEGEYTPDMRT